ncbi:hypothetical protein [Klebsiella pneumoniae]|uniref:hypothetical protein n=1 Tax=Klebsiella pneumoniae TaxID=573 RepID=UPI001A8E3C85|nr:hypothetical protein [Klebsiella pneumoniae]QSS11339.1 hypothetical protein H4I73_28460 [Klebsiella pneumoniae]
MKVNYLAPLLCIGVLALTGCNDPKKPSESNFKEAAQQYLDTVYPACYIKANFPYKQMVSTLTTCQKYCMQWQKKGC